ncbi:hypothetical protein AMECASPLE_025806 [Ameca splendens]|uniref:Secreted protein n=1 Tax=Ameca splendens TaxID=208324 RepID=A0ABV0ZQ72_9TELE
MILDCLSWLCLPADHFCAAAIRRIAFTCSFPASSLITNQLLHPCTWLYKQDADRQTVPVYQKALSSKLWTSTFLLPSDYRCLPNPWIRLPESASLFMTSFLCPDHRILHIPGCPAVT